MLCSEFFLSVPRRCSIDSLDSFPERDMLMRYRKGDGVGHHTASSSDDSTTTLTSMAANDEDEESEQTEPQQTRFQDSHVVDDNGDSDWEDERPVPEDDEEEDDGVEHGEPDSEGEEGDILLGVEAELDAMDLASL